MTGTLRDAVRMEVVRLLTVRSTYVLLGTAVALGAVVALLLGVLNPAGALTPEDTTTAVTDGGDAAPLSVVGVLMGVLAVTSVSHDYRWGLARALLTAQPHRGVLIAARLLVLSAAGAAAAALASALGAGLCVAFGRLPVLDGTTLRVVLLHIGVVVGWVWLGAGVTWILRHAAGAVAFLLGGPVLELVLLLVVRVNGSARLASVVAWLPFTAGRQALGRDLTAQGPVPGAAAAAAAFALEAAAVIALAAVTVRRRDA